MRLHFIDWLIIVAYCLFSLVIGLLYTRRASKSTDEFFVGGRRMSWWLIGTSLVATTFASDTPLVVSAMVRKGGIADNWLWWNSAMAGVMTVFFFAHLWRRSHVLTDVEFYELRYGGSPASFLRGFNALYLGVFGNCITMGWVMLGMANVAQVVCGWNKLWTLVILVALTSFYTVLSGVWGAVLTDLVQFIIAMAGSIMLAAIVLWQCGGPAAMIHQIHASPGFNPRQLDLFPSFSHGFDLPLLTFLILLSSLWWGAAQGSGYIAQRLFSAKNERHAVLAMLWFVMANYVLRPWPWILVGMASLIFFPLTVHTAPEQAYPNMIVRFLPTGLRGVMVASFLAAFMSTMTTQLNWGASYLVNDLYRRFAVAGRSEHHYVQASRVATVLLTGLAALTAWQLDTIQGAWIYMIMLTAGGALAGLLRWYWWRVNAWSEISAMIASFLLANGFLLSPLLPASLRPALDRLYSEPYYAVRALIILLLGTATWLVVTLLTRPVDLSRLEDFYRRVRPGGWWAPVARRCPDVVAREPVGPKWAAWALGSACIYAALFGVGYVCLARYLLGLTCLVVASALGAATILAANRLHPHPSQQPALAVPEPLAAPAAVAKSHL